MSTHERFPMYFFLTVETPEAVAMIAEEIETTVRRGPEQLFNDLDIQLKPVGENNR